MQAYALTTHDGKTVDNLTDAALRECERRLGYPLTIVQGSYNAGRVTASAGTHDGGGVVDLAPWDWRRKVRVLRDVGFAAWHRPAIPGLWGEHIHAVLMSNKKLATSAAVQVSDYKQGRNGLANNAPDDDPYRPNPLPWFTLPAPAQLHPASQGRRVDTARATLEEAAHVAPAGSKRRRTIRGTLAALRLVPKVRRRPRTT